jgi:hypothetical protein
MSTAEYGFMFPVPGPPAYTCMIAETVLQKSALGEMELYKRLIHANKASLWCLPGRGFALFGVRFFGSINIKELILYAAEGHGMVHWKAMRLLFDLARKEKYAQSPHTTLVEAMGLHGTGQP